LAAKAKAEADASQIELESERHDLSELEESTSSALIDSSSEEREEAMRVLERRADVVAAKGAWSNAKLLKAAAATERVIAEKELARISAADPDPRALAEAESKVVEMDAGVVEAERAEAEAEQELQEATLVEVPGEE